LTASALGRLALCVALCLAIGFLGGRQTAAEIPTWYAGLTKPSWTPPNWAFPVVWTTLYVLMGLALWRLWESGNGGRKRAVAVVAFFVQLALNAAWTPVFFGLHWTQLALAIIAVMILAIALTIRLSAQVDRMAAWLLVPYLAWVAYAATLNAGIVVLNP
jgi:benzodiazapine receptor